MNVPWWGYVLLAGLAWGTYVPIIFYGGTELTETGQKAAAAFTQQDNPRFRCETTSVIFDWAFDSPVNRITQGRDTIVLQYGQMSLKRTIHLDLKTHPANVKPSRAGHSIGRWEGDTLVVDVKGFTDRTWFDTAGDFHSGDLHVIERYTRTGPDTLSYEATIDDPKTYTKPFTIRMTINRHTEKNFQLREYECYGI